MVIIGHLRISFLMKRLFYILLLAPLYSSCEQSEPLLQEYKLVWSDEFNGSELDDSKWEAMIGDGSQYGIWGWGNNESQYYREENATVFNGSLKIKAIKENFGGYEYTSSRLRSLNSGDFKYGKIEASIKMDNSGGLWHAFWMLPSSPNEPWPISGEIDIMEYVGNSPNEILNTVHMSNSAGQQLSLGESVPFVNDFNFHKYAIEWNANKITWLVDDQETYSVLRTNSAVNNTWPFDAEFHLLLNTAVGGNLGGIIDDNALQIPKYMEVDYVRVYQKR